MPDLKTRLDRICGHMLGKQCCGCLEPITTVLDFSRLGWLFTYGVCDQCAGDPDKLDEIRAKVMEGV
jgi:hypothetical protein